MVRHGIRKPRVLKVRCYADHMNDLNEYLAVFPGEKASDKICETELNKMFLNSMPTRYIRQAYVQGFYFESIT